jgi:hypothetical protein
VYAQYPAVSDIEQLENGQLVYVTAAGEVTFVPTDKPAEAYLVFNEVKLYDERKQSDRDYVQKVADSTNGKIVPRLFKLSIGDVYTTDQVADGTYAVGDHLVLSETDGVLKKGDAGPIVVAKETTLPDGVTPAVKLRVAAEVAVA